jgi:hypothetical protein
VWGYRGQGGHPCRVPVSGGNRGSQAVIPGQRVGGGTPDRGFTGWLVVNGGLRSQVDNDVWHGGEGVCST